MKLAVFYAFARSGGTLVNRCIGCIPGNLVLSEVNPHASVIPPEQQAHEWWKLISGEEVNVLKMQTYIQKIRYLAQKTHERQLNLIVRDWSAVNFLGDLLVQDFLTPSYVLEQEVYLLRGELTYCSAVISRRAEDVYASIIKSFAERTPENFRFLSAEDFGKRYLHYAKSVSRYRIFHYEDICDEPEAQIKELCEYLEIQYDASFLHKFKHFNQCTGDSQPVIESRGFKLDVITRLKSHVNSEYYINAHQDEHCREANRLLGYE
ncbi:sulfotransferase family protein [Leptolyngbya sp. O-77]|uniref:sulfotransferase family protein n=1 Tax=Leptolyngbya sp. O-77 TaxID=1080068 RepID=UPI00074D3744|nr:sulfotransferase family protein [Leptolyngbya sp. O-77]BAU40426.1 hypothetical protein O77CONTIG1_00223 [Leptolyngbya sp. O-77]